MLRFMTKIENTFKDVMLCHGDIWVADYTEKTKHLPKEERKGVTIQELPFEDIASFHLQNASGIGILAVNFERNKGFFPQGVHDCECMCRPKDVGKGWLLLCELKYCKMGNICDNANKAYHQLIDTWKEIDGKGFYDRKHCRVYLNISVPEHEYSLPPFAGFIANQNEQLKFMKKYKLHLLGVNSVLAVDSGILLVCKPTV